MSILIKTICTSCIALLIFSCASTHNFAEDGRSAFGGGYRSNEVEKGIFRIEARTNATPWENYGDARDMWTKLAKEACEDKEYVEKYVKEYSYENTPAFFGIVPYTVTVKEGLAVCHSKGAASAVTSSNQ